MGFSSSWVFAWGKMEKKWRVEERRGRERSAGDGEQRERGEVEEDGAWRATRESSGTVGLGESGLLHGAVGLMELVLCSSMALAGLLLLKPAVRGSIAWFRIDVWGFVFEWFVFGGFEGVVRVWSFMVMSCSWCAVTFFVDESSIVCVGLLLFEARSWFVWVADFE
ncbi:hypothetical protein Droror1_Dr00000211 [Drosera rotundifolia]